MMLDYKYTTARNLEFVENLLTLKKTKSVWKVIDFIVKAWIKTHPTEWDSFITELEIDKKSRKRTWVGNKEYTGVSKQNGSMLRYTLDIPVRIVNIIRRLYPATELPFDKRFYSEFSKRFPKFVVSERL